MQGASCKEHHAFGNPEETARATEIYDRRPVYFVKYYETCECFQQIEEFSWTLNGIKLSEEFILKLLCTYSSVSTDKIVGTGRLSSNGAS